MSVDFECYEFFADGFETHVEEKNHEDDYYCNGDEASCGCTIIWITTIAKEVALSKEIGSFEDVFDCLAAAGHECSKVKCSKNNKIEESFYVFELFMREIAL